MEWLRNAQDPVLGGQLGALRRDVVAQQGAVMTEWAAAREVTLRPAAEGHAVMAEWAAAREATERPAAEEHAVISESTAAREARVRPAAEEPSGAEQFDAGCGVARGAHDFPRCDSSRASTLI